MRVIRDNGKRFFDGLPGHVQITHLVRGFRETHGTLEFLSELFGGFHRIAQLFQLCAVFVQTDGPLEVLERGCVLFLAERIFGLQPQLLYLFVDFLPLYFFLQVAQQVRSLAVVPVDFQDLHHLPFGAMQIVALDELRGFLEIAVNHLLLQLALQLAQVEGELFRRGIAFVAVFGQCAIDNRLKLRRIGSQKIFQRRRRLMNDLQQRGRGTLAFEGQRVGEQLIQHHAGRENVGAGIDLSPVHLLRRHIADAADNLAGAGDVLVAEVGDAKIDDLYATAGAHHDVGRLDVAVHDPARVRIVQTLADGNHQFDFFHDAELPAR